jgi:hypothetical protein
VDAAIWPGGDMVGDAVGGAWLLPGERARPSLTPGGGGPDSFGDASFPCPETVPSPVASDGPSRP